MARARGAALIPLGALDAWRVISRRRPDVVIGVGGYSSGPVVAVAAMRGIPAMLLEQNAVPGLTNRMLARFVDRACVTYEASLKYFGRKGFVSGNPVRREFLEVDDDPSHDAALNASRVRVLVFGGSQGAHAINVAMVEAAPRLAAAAETLDLVCQTGTRRLRRGSSGVRAARRARPRGTVHRCDGPRDEGRRARRVARGCDDARGGDGSRSARDSDSAADSDRRSPAAERTRAGEGRRRRLDGAKRFDGRAAGRSHHRDRERSRAAPSGCRRPLDRSPDPARRKTLWTR